MKGIQIVSTGHALPKHQVTNQDLSQIVDTNDEWITTRTGIQSRYKCEEESCVSLAIEAAKQAIEKGNIPLDEIGAVLVATSTPDYAFPSAACMVQKGLGLPEEVISFDISAACTGFLYGLKIAQGMIYTISKKYILVVGSEQLSRIIDYSDRSTCILFGDGAGAAVVTAASKQYVQKSWTRGNQEVLWSYGIGAERNFIRMKGNDVFKFAVGALQQGIDEVLEASNLTMDDIDYVVCHQANLRIIGHVQKKYKGYEDKFYINIQKYGNTSAASIPIALDEMNEAGMLKEGQRIICVGFGAGLTWSGALIEL